MIPADVRIIAAAAPVDMRRGFIGLAEAARQQLGQDPQGGALFVFANRRRDRLKLLRTSNWAACGIPEGELKALTELNWRRSP